MKPLRVGPIEHELKILPEYFKLVSEGKKNFEVRKDDRGYQENDILILKEWIKPCTEYPEGHYSGKELRKRITYILKGNPSYGLREKYVVLGIQGEFESSKRLEK